jgi:hypothetical protein
MSKDLEKRVERIEKHLRLDRLPEPSTEPKPKKKEAASALADK